MSMKKFLTAPSSNKTERTSITESQNIVSWSVDPRGRIADDTSVYSIDNSLNEKICLWKGDMTKLKIGKTFTENNISLTNF